MAGLLDMLGGYQDETAPASGGLDDPKIQGLLTAGLAMLGSRGNFAQALSEGGLAGLQSMQQGRAFGQQSAMRDMQLQQQRMAMAEAQRKQQYLANLKAPSDDPQTAMLYDMVRNGFADPSALIKDNTPLVLKEGESVVDKKTFKPLYSNPKNDDPSEVKEYRFAQQQGYRGTFENFVMEKRRAGAQTITMGSPTVVTDPRTGQQLVVQPGNRPGAPAIPITLPGGTFAAPGESGTKTAETRAALKDATDSIALIKQARELLPNSSNGIVSKSLSIGAGWGGISTQAAQADAQLAAIGGMLVSKMPKMSGPQSDKDVANYKEMAGKVADTTLPVKTRMAALDAVEEIQRRYAADAQNSIANQYKPIGAPRAPASSPGTAPSVDDLVNKYRSK